MSSFKVEVIKIDEVLVHPNADRLELCVVRGWNVVAQKGLYRAGDLCVYVPIDSVLPRKIEDQLFPEGSKIKLQKSRVRSIRIRGAVSQGMLIRPDEFGLQGKKEGDDVTDILGIVKYEPPEESIPGLLNTSKASTRKQPNVHFRKYTDMENFKNHPKVFEEGENVWVTEKLHGTSARYMWAPREELRGLFGRFITWFLKLFGLWRPFEFVFGSRNVQLHVASNRNAKYELTNVYGKIAAQEDIINKLKPGEGIYGEIVGPGVQKGYHYGITEGKHEFFAYDVLINGRWLDPHEFRAFCAERGFKHVPELYHGPYNKDVVLSYRDGDSTLGNQKVREGVVVKPEKESIYYGGRKVLKMISDEYLLNKDNTDFH